MLSVQSRAPVVLCVALVLAVLFSVSVSAQGAGEHVYRTKCTLCHGPDGSGSSLGKKMKVHDLRSPEVQQQSDADLTYIITNGKNNMPPFKNKLSAEQFPEVLSYIRALAKKK